MTQTSNLTPGDNAPDFKLPASDGKTYSLASYKGKSPVVLYFYPKADTPGCTKEACGFRDAIASYHSLNVPVFGISPDPVEDVTAFAKKFDLNFPLLADADHAICEKYGTWVLKNFMGKSSMGAARSTFIIGSDGNIAKVYEKVDVDGHEQAVLSFLNESGLAQASAK